ncbi:MAG: hypothetical protein HW380_1072 [Magnetococcales bacterium]|nr:hypothetical protein [Magnetococcales bacterium]
MPYPQEDPLEKTWFFSFRRAFSDGKKNFTLENLDDATPHGAWMDWSEKQGWVRWQVRSTCDHQCRLGSLTELGRTILDGATQTKSHAQEQLPIIEKR